MAATGEVSSAGPAVAGALARRPGARERGAGLLLSGLFAAWLIWLFDALNNLAPVRQQLAERDGERVLDFERSLQLAPEHALNAWLAAHAELSRIVVFWYANVHVGAIVAVLAWLWWRRPDLLPVMVSTWMIVSALALAVFWTFPTAPLRMLPGGYVDLVSAVHGLPVWQRGATALDSNQLCSLPSLHVAGAVWCSIAVWQITSRRWLRVAATIYPLMTTFAVMATANHYLLDAVTGAGATLVVFFAMRRVFSRPQAA